MKTFENQEELEQFLISKGIDTSLWGKGDAKSVSDLWNEIISGDSSIQAKPFMRIVNAVKIIIRKDKKVLTEFQQELQDGRKRSRNMLPSEKKHIAENYRAAVKRAIYEEFGINEDDIESIIPTGETKQEIRESISYPGLLTRYRYYFYEARINNLPGSEFWTIEKREAHSPIKRHLWKWKVYS
jgi:hypothetical protein